MRAIACLQSERTRLRSTWVSATRRAHPSALASAFGPTILSAIASACGASAGSFQIEIVNPCRNAFVAKRALPALSWDPCLPWRWPGWRAVVEWWSRCRLYTQLARFDVAEFDACNFIDRPADGSAARFAMSVDFSKSVVSPRLGACQHSIDPLEDIDFPLQRLRRHLIDRQSRLRKNGVDFLARVLVSRRPLLTNEAVFEIGMANNLKSFVHSSAHGGFKDSGLDGPKAMDFPSQIDDVANEKFFDCIPRPGDADDAAGGRGVVSFLLAWEERRVGNRDHSVENVDR
jgi:hypothetical protein